MLGLTEIREMREASIDDSGGYCGSRWGRYWDEDDDEPDVESLDTDGELIDGDITLSWWMDLDTGTGESVASRVAEEDADGHIHLAAHRSRGRARRLYGRLRQYRRALVSAGRDHSVASGIVVRRPCRGWVRVGA